jgi:hypothetical protein
LPRNKSAPCAILTQNKGISLRGLLRFPHPSALSGSFFRILGLMNNPSQTMTGTGEPSVRELEVRLSDTGRRAADAENLLRDLAAFVQDFGGDKSLPVEHRLKVIVQTISHDVGGILGEAGSCFLPRTHRWALNHGAGANLLARCK